MSRTSTLILLGVLIILTPYSGLPIAIRTLLEVVFGALVAGIGLLIRTREIQNVASAEPPAPAPESERAELEALPQSVSPI
ncbi:MAG: hypothetical protein AAB442_03620 [Patescibacteria group bacterium]